MAWDIIRPQPRDIAEAVVLSLGGIAIAFAILALIIWIGAA